MAAPRPILLGGLRLQLHAVGRCNIHSLHSCKASACRCKRVWIRIRVDATSKQLSEYIYKYIYIWHQSGPEREFAAPAQLVKATNSLATRTADVMSRIGVWPQPKLSSGMLATDLLISGNVIQALQSADSSTSAAAGPAGALAPSSHLNTGKQQRK